MQFLVPGFWDGEQTWAQHITTDWGRLMIQDIGYHMCKLEQKFTLKERTVRLLVGLSERKRKDDLVFMWHLMYRMWWYSEEKRNFKYLNMFVRNLWGRLCAGLTRRLPWEKSLSTDNIKRNKLGKWDSKRRERRIIEFLGLLPRFVR